MGGQDENQMGDPPRLARIRRRHYAMRSQWTNSPHRYTRLLTLETFSRRLRDSEGSVCHDDIDRLSEIWPVVNTVPREVSGRITLYRYPKLLTPEIFSCNPCAQHLG